MRLLFTRPFSACSLIGFTLLALVASSCHGHRHGNGSAASAAAPAATTVPDHLRFGSGGGFTGLLTTYTLYADGRLERRAAMPGADTTQPGTALPRVATGKAAACLRMFAALPADSLRVNQPGNLSYFLEGRAADGRRHRLTWAGTGAGVPHSVRALYRDLNALVPGADH